MRKGPAAGNPRQYECLTSSLKFGRAPNTMISMNNDRFDIYTHYVAVFNTDLNRFEMSCPDCKQGCNSKAGGGNEKCFHCDNCGLVECEVTSPVLAEDSSISAYGEDQ